MRRFGLLAAIVLVHLACATALRADTARTRHSTAPGDILISAQFETAVSAYGRGDAAMVVDSLTTGMQDDIFPQLSATKQYEVAEMYAIAAQARGLWAEAHRGFVRATASPNASREDWDLRMISAIAAGDGTDAYFVFRRRVDRGESVLQPYTAYQIDQFDQLIGDLPNAREARLALGAQMERDGWEPVYPDDDGSNLWLHYAQALLDAGDQKHAVSVAAKITSPMILMAMHADRRFDSIAAVNPGVRDPESAALRYLAWAESISRQNPRLLSARFAVVRALNILNRSEDSLPLLEDAAQQVATAPREGPAPFDDMEQASNIEKWRTSVLLSLGRPDEGIAARKAAAACNCSSLAILSLAHALMDADRAAEAQSWLRRARVDGLGLRERMEMAQTSGCVAAQLGDGPELAKQLAFLSAHETWKPEARVGALVCANRLDEATTVLTRQIRDPRTRLAALSLLQDYAVTPTPPPYAATLSARWKALTARPDLRAEAAKVGRIDSFSLTQWESVS